MSYGDRASHERGSNYVNMAETWFSHHVLSCTSRHRNAWFVSYRKGDAAKGRRYWPVFPSMHHPRRVRRTCQFIGTGSANGLVRSPIAGVRRVHEGLGSSLGGDLPQKEVHATEGVCYRVQIASCNP